MMYGVQCTFGEWNTESFGSAGEYLGTSVLTVCSDNIAYQNAMTLDPVGRTIVYNLWDLSTGTMIDGDDTAYISALTGNLYNLYIRYSETTWKWQLWWNWTLLWEFPNDSSHRLKTGSHPFVVVESNSYDVNDFSGFSTSIGGTQSGVKLPAVAFLFNSDWKPFNSGDNSPAGYAYLGNSYINGIKVGVTAPPTNWGYANIGESSSSRGVLEIGVGLTQRYTGYTYWTYGPI